MLNQFVPFFHFKMERLSLLKHLTQEGDCMCPIGSTLKEIHKISVEGDSLQVHVLVFWTRLSTTDIYKVIENSNLSPEKNQHHNNIFGQYVDFESHNTRSSHELRHGQLSPAKFGFYNKYKNINFVPVSENRISGNGDRFNQNDIVIGTREGTKSCQDLSEPSQESLTRVVGLLSSTIQALEPAKIQLRFLQQQKIVCLREKMNYQSVITLNTNSRTELSWWIENLRFCNS